MPNEGFKVKLYKVKILKRSIKTLNIKYIKGEYRFINKTAKITYYN